MDDSRARALKPAAQYLRMSTDQQPYSILSQSISVQRYADDHGFTIVRTYEDPGRSGLSLKGRKGLAKLLHDVLSGEAPFNAILVYDVSRWGRFQDSDEAAHHEYVCKNAGVPVHYCAEVFENNATLPNTIMKALKRAMAGEYSRELSVRIARAKRLTTAEGFRSGGRSGYALRRMFMSPEGKRKRLLEKGEYISTGHVILVPGPPREVEVVREIYRLCIDEKKNLKAIARELNDTHIKPPGPRPWCYDVVREILTNPKYMGQAVVGRTTCRLHSPVVDQARDKWTVRDGAFPPIVDPNTFAAAQAVLTDRTFYRSNEELLTRLRAFVAREGMLSEHMIDTSRDLPATRTYVARFGSIKRVYELIGYDYSGHILSHPKMRKRMWSSRFRRERLRGKLLRNICALFPKQVKMIRKGSLDRPILSFKDGLRVSVLICPSARTPLGAQRWRIPPLRAGMSDVTLLCLCAVTNDAFQDFHLVASVVQPERSAVKREHKCFKLGTRVRDLSRLRAIAERVRRETRASDVPRFNRGRCVCDSRLRNSTGLD